MKFLQSFFTSFSADLKWLEPFKRLYASERPSRRVKEKSLGQIFFALKLIHLTKRYRLSFSPRSVIEVKLKIIQPGK